MCLSLMLDIACETAAQRCIDMGQLDRQTDRWIVWYKLP